MIIAFADGPFNQPKDLRKHITVETLRPRRDTEEGGTQQHRAGEGLMGTVGREWGKPKRIGWTGGGFM